MTQNGTTHHPEEYYSQHGPEHNLGQCKASRKWTGSVLPWPSRVLPSSTHLGRLRARAGSNHYRFVGPMVLLLNHIKALVFIFFFSY